MSLSLNDLSRNRSLQNAAFFLQTCLPCKVDPVIPAPIFTGAPTSLVRCPAQFSVGTGVAWILSLRNPVVQGSGN
jgi:hypothetical protein